MQITKTTSKYIKSRFRVRADRMGFWSVSQCISIMSTLMLISTSYASFNDSSTLIRVRARNEHQTTYPESESSNSHPHGSLKLSPVSLVRHETIQYLNNYTQTTLQHMIQWQMFLYGLQRDASILLNELLIMQNHRSSIVGEVYSQTNYSKREKVLVDSLDKIADIFRRRQSFLPEFRDTFNASRSFVSQLPVEKVTTGQFLQSGTGNFTDWATLCQFWGGSICILTPVYVVVFIIRCQILECLYRR